MADKEDADAIYKKIIADPSNVRSTGPVITPRMQEIFDEAANAPAQTFSQRFTESLDHAVCRTFHRRWHVGFMCIKCGRVSSL